VQWSAAAESGIGALIGATFGAYIVGEQTLALNLLTVFGLVMLRWPTVTSCPTSWPVTCWPPGAPAVTSQKTSANAWLDLPSSPIQAKCGPDDRDKKRKLEPARTSVVLPRTGTPSRNPTIAGYR
jgi:hypothetical protein